MNLIAHKKPTLLLALCIATSFGVHAAHITPFQALQRATATEIMRTSSTVAYNLAYAETKNGTETLYVFSRDNAGFIIAPADNSFPAIIGYSDEGNFDVTTASPEMMWWLSQYSQQVSACQSESDIVRAGDSFRPEVAPLINTKWNQYGPYNRYCPMDNGYRTLTGCVATAMAQVIKYHGYPEKGTKNFSYTWNGQKLSYRFGDADFKYDDMLNEYDYGYTEAQANAVADLMYACGVSVKMNYSSGASSAYSRDIAYALRFLFEYDGTTRFLKRDYYSAAQWDDIVYEELAAGRPVLYSGATPEGGHQFVCDGYRNGYFHINWGWGGSSDGYFMLSLLNPSDQGAGSFEGGYNSFQDIVCGIQPGKSTTPYWYPIYASGGIQVAGVNGSIVEINTTRGGVYNYSPEVFSPNFYLKCVPVGATEDKAILSRPMKLSFQKGSMENVYGYNKFGVYTPGSLPEGKYRAYIVFETVKGFMEPLLVPYGEADYIDLTVDAEGNYSFTTAIPEKSAIIQVSSLQPVNGVKGGEVSDFKMQVKNLGELDYSGPVTVKAFKADSEVWSTQLNIDVAKGEIKETTVTLNLQLPVGEYELICYDKAGKQVSAAFPIDISESTVAQKPEAITLDITRKTMEAGGTLQLTSTVTPENAEDKTVTWKSSDVAVATVTDGLVTALSEGNVVITATTVNNISAECSISVYGISSVDMIPATGKTAVVYTTDGIILNSAADTDYLRSLPAGIYIVNVSDKIYKLHK